MKKNTMVGLVATLLATLVTSPTFAQPVGRPEKDPTKSAEVIDRPTNDSVPFYIFQYCAGLDTLREYLKTMRDTYTDDWNKMDPSVQLTGNNVISGGGSTCAKKKGE